MLLLQLPRMRRTSCSNCQLAEAKARRSCVGSDGALFSLEGPAVRERRGRTRHLYGQKSGQNHRNHGNLILLPQRDSSPIRSEVPASSFEVAPLARPPCSRAVLVLCFASAKNFSSSLQQPYISTLRWGYSYTVQHAVLQVSQAELIQAVPTIPELRRLFDCSSTTKYSRIMKISIFF
jgi:hypothetical protein